MKECILNMQGVKTLREAHQRIAELLSFPPYYGANLDALYDTLSGEIELPVKLIWIAELQVGKALAKDLENILQVFRDFADEEPGFQLEVR